MFLKGRSAIYWSFLYPRVCVIVVFSKKMFSAMFFMFCGCLLTNIYFARLVLLDHHMSVIVFSWDYNFECIWSDTQQYRIIV